MAVKTTKKTEPGASSAASENETMDYPEELLFSKGAQVRYRRILDLQKLAIHVIDPSLRLIFYNTFARDWTARLGYVLKEDVHGKSLFTLFPFLGKDIEKEYRQVFESGQNLYTEESLQLKGKKIYVQVEKIPVVFDNKVAEIITIIRDVTKKREVEADLKSSEERFKKLFEYAPVAYYMSDLKGTFLAGNRAAEALIGAKRDKFIGQNYLNTQLIPKDQLSTAAKILAQTILGKITGPFEIVLNRQDGSKTWVEVSTIPIKIQGKIRLLGGVVDITQRKLAQENEKALVSSLQCLSDSGMRLAEVSRQEDIFQVIGELMHTLIGECYVGVSDYSPEDGSLEVKSLIGAKAYIKDILKILGRNPVGMKFKPDPEALLGRLQTQQLLKIPGGLHEVTFYNVPKTVCLALEKLAHIRSVYSVGFIRKGTIFGSAVVLLRDKDELANQELVESFTFQASVALQRWKAENRITASLKEKEVLLREIHHRVKNNMQIISSLLRLQSNGISDPAARDSLQISQDRIRSMALVHEGLYRSEDLSHIDFAEYVRKLSGHLYSISADKGLKISFDIEIDDIRLDVNQAIPCGLIINELVTNSLKHAFPEERKGEVSIHMRKGKKGELTLIVADNGIGLSTDIDLRNTESLGMQIVTDLVQQLSGTIRMRSGQGTEFKIRF